MKPWRSRTTFELILLLGSPSAVVKRLKSKTGRSWPCCWPSAEQYSRHTKRRARHLRALPPSLEFRDLHEEELLVCRTAVGMSPLREFFRRHGIKRRTPFVMLLASRQKGLNELLEYNKREDNKKGRQGFPIIIKCQRSSHHQISVKAAVLNGFADVFRANISTSGHISYRPPHSQNAVIGTGRRPSFVIAIFNNSSLGINSTTLMVEGTFIEYCLILTNYLSRLRLVPFLPCPGCGNVYPYSRLLYTHCQRRRLILVP